MAGRSGGNPLLARLEFRSNNAGHRPVIQALDLLERYIGSKARLPRLSRVSLGCGGCGQVLHACNTSTQAGQVGEQVVVF